MGRREDELPFRIELWDDAVEELIAWVSDFTTAQSTYDDAVERRPKGKLITLRQKARVIKKSR